MEIEVGFSVEGPDLAERNDGTSDLQDFLAMRSDIPIRRVKEDMTTQDAGTLLVAVLAAPAVVDLVKGPLTELAKGISDWLRARNGTITVSEGEIKVENVRADQVLAALEKVLSAKK